MEIRKELLLKLYVKAETLKLSTLTVKSLIVFILEAKHNENTRRKLTRGGKHKK